MAQEDEPPPRTDGPESAKAGGKPPEAPKKPGPLRNPLVLVGIGLVVVIVAVGVVIWWLNARRWQATDDAYIDGHIVHLAPQVAGVVVKVYVTDNAEVPTGQRAGGADRGADRPAAGAGRRRARHLCTGERRRGRRRRAGPAGRRRP